MLFQTNLMLFQTQMIIVMLLKMYWSEWCLLSLLVQWPPHHCCFPQ